MQINTIQKLIDMLQLQKINLPTYTTEVAATPADIADVTADLNNLVYLVDYAELVDANKKVVTQIKNAVFNGDAGIEIPPLPAFPAGVPPTALIADCLGRALARNARFKVGPGFTPEIGTALGMNGGYVPPDPGSVKPTIEVSAAQTGYLFSVVVTNRGDSDMWDVLILGKGETTWTLAKSATGKSTDVTVPANLANDPQQFQVRIQLKKKNQNYGQLSDIVYVTVNP